MCPCSSSCIFKLCLCRSLAKSCWELQLCFYSEFYRNLPVLNSWDNLISPGLSNSILWHPPFRTCALWRTEVFRLWFDWWKSPFQRTRRKSPLQYRCRSCMIWTAFPCVPPSQQFFPLYVFLVKTLSSTSPLKIPFNWPLFQLLLETSFAVYFSLYVLYSNSYWKHLFLCVPLPIYNSCMVWV